MEEGPKEWQMAEGRGRGQRGVAWEGTAWRGGANGCWHLAPGTWHLAAGERGRGELGRAAGSKRVAGGLSDDWGLRGWIWIWMGMRMRMGMGITLRLEPAKDGVKDPRTQGPKTRTQDPRFQSRQSD